MKKYSWRDVSVVLVRMSECVTEFVLIGGGRDVGVTGSLRRTTVELEVVVVWEMMTRGVWWWCCRRSVTRLSS